MFEWRRFYKGHRGRCEYFEVLHRNVFLFVVELHAKPVANVAKTINYLDGTSKPTWGTSYYGATGVEKALATQNPCACTRDSM